ncbi:SusD-like starch-binding protein associating with outer membrane [Chitinophaga dinghuensis]|uniref:SusD-like starch-binding protein associating with outer membrane n=1 Tax=Chitinophaga dinghuensis TaxID=1539050 RepID=A0A327VZJ6_9BACT|nr:RagB/SusD family nutrient uptake outer membrane protein [Chitinophaga dinghuensis]RAJ80174.1 SusD-like starch-binding protein associating with outer membrane [Chitinophaga dinghuensis]
MKKLSYSIYLAGLLLLNAGCSKQLDLKPEGTMVEADLLKDRQSAESFLADAYLQTMNACGADAYMLGDITGNIVSSFDQALVKGAIDPRDKNYEPYWQRPYAAINEANVIINNLPTYATFDPAIQKQFIGEAKFIRAYCHLILLQMYGDGALQGQGSNMGIPIMTTAFEGYDGSQNKARNTNAEVYTQILKDLDDAIAALPAVRSASLDQGSRATSGAAAALASRVCLYKQDYQRAATYANMVLNGNQYTLQKTFAAMWPNNGTGTGNYPINAETIFAFPESYNATANYGENNGIYYAYGYYTPLPDFLASYDATDDRFLAIKGGTFVPKYTDMRIRDNVIMIRLAEVMLTAAEAQAQVSGVNQGSVDLLNKIYSRSFSVNAVPKVYTMGDFTSKQQLIDRILLERKRELAFEGFARFDAIRYGKQPNPLMQPANYAMPIPQHEIDITGGLIKQNPGYVK